MLINPISLEFIKEYSLNAGTPLGLVGPEGVGKIYVSKWLANKLLGADDIFNHPYIFYIDATDSGIEDVRELQKNLRLTVPGQKSIKRIAIINNFEKFGREAQNSLLKLIEEPPMDTQIVIMINNISFVLPTILSRVQIINVLPIDLSLSLNSFANQYSEPKIKKAYAISGGNAELLHAILSEDTSNNLLKSIELSKQILSLEKYQRIAQIDKILKDKEVDINTLIESFIKILSAMYKQSLEKAQSSETNLNRLSSAIKCLDNISLGVNKKLALTQFFSKI